MRKKHLQLSKKVQMNLKNVEQKQPETKEYKLYDSIYVKHKIRQSSYIRSWWKSELKHMTEMVIKTISTSKT